MTLHSRIDFTQTQSHPGTSARSQIPLHRAEELTRGGTLANIELSGQVYALRITRAGKLILTK